MHARPLLDIGVWPLGWRGIRYEVGSSAQDLYVGEGTLVALWIPVAINN